MQKDCRVATLLLLACQLSFAQQRFVVPDSLVHKSYAYFAERLDEDELPSAVSHIYSESYLQKAKSEGSYSDMVGAYKAMLYLSKNNMRIAYADSMVHAAAKANSRSLLGAAHLTRGIVLYDLKKYEKALDAYLLADEMIADSGDAYLQNKLKFNVAQIKYYLGFYEEASAMFAGCVSYFEKDGGTPYLSSLHSLGLCYSSLGKLDLCSLTNELGLKEAISSGNESFAPYYVHSEGINQYFKKNYSGALSKLRQALPGIKNNGHEASETMAHFYMAKSHIAMGNYSLALPFLKKVDSSFSQKDYIRPDLRESYELLIRHYKKQGDLKAQLYYVNRLLRADSIIEKNFRYLSAKMSRVYDTRELLESRKKLEGRLQSKEIIARILAVLLFIAAVLVVLLAIGNARKRKIYDRLMSEEIPFSEQEKWAPPKGEIGINAEVVESILAGLLKFESGKSFLEKDLTISRLAAILDSNTKYAAKVIYHHRGQKSIDYINGLKVAYMVKLLKESARHRNYTQQALAEEAGFNTSQHFARAFLKHVGIAPTYFIERLNARHRPGGPNE
ncbi:AraC family transcriptional regulator [uncultured Flavobacterium sp.]|uniref:helix-turn-helix domain-containing protein n=1 Tax=uncultured Flavobacterium sp. TaxID=165435 RepID=UPI0025EC9E82|nr:AraC family transcriptional regulator [uncultured Flavobacterium sp.]